MSTCSSAPERLHRLSGRRGGGRRPMREASSGRVAGQGSGAVRAPVHYGSYDSYSDQMSASDIRPKSQPLSVRLAPPAYTFVKEEAERTRRAKGAVVEDLLEEAIRVRLFPGIGFKGPDPDRRAWVVGTGLDVSDVIRMLEDFGSVERLAAETHLEPRHVRLAVAYHERFPDEIDRHLKSNRLPLEELQERYPFAATLIVDE